VCNFTCTRSDWCVFVSGFGLIKEESNTIHGKEGCVKENGKVHEEAAISNVVEVVLDVLVNLKSAISTKLP